MKYQHLVIVGMVKIVGLFNMTLVGGYGLRTVEIVGMVGMVVR